MSFAEKAREVGSSVIETTISKNLAYGNSFQTSAQALQLLYPEGIGFEQMQDALLLVRVWDKMQRIATDKDAFGEDPWRDITGYGLIAITAKALKEHRETVLVLPQQVALPIKLEGNCSYCNHPPSSHGTTPHSGERKVCRHSMDTTGLAVCPCDDFR